jgi:hypothetical protein
MAVWAASGAAKAIPAARVAKARNIMAKESPKVVLTAQQKQFRPDEKG